MNSDRAIKHIRNFVNQRKNQKIDPVNGFTIAREYKIFLEQVLGMTKN